VPIRARLALIVALVTTLVVVVGGDLFGRQLRQSTSVALDDALRPRSDAIAQAVHDTTDPKNADDRTKELVGDEQLAQVLDPKGNVVLASGSLAATPLLNHGQLVHARRHEMTFTRTDSRAADTLRVHASPVLRSDGTWLVVVGSSLRGSELVLERVRYGLIVGGSLVVVAATAGAWLLAGAALRPIERTRRQVAAITEHGPEVTLTPTSTRDELERMTLTVNDLLVRLYDARATDRRLIADAGHELRTPLAVLRTELELAARPGRSAAELRDSVGHAVHEVDRLARLADNLLVLARNDAARQIDPQPVPVQPLLVAAAVATRGRASASSVDIVVDAPDDPVLLGEADQIRRAVDNLLDNALRVAPPGSTIELRAAVDDGCCTIEVLDEGTGFPPDFLPRAFDRFSRPESDRRSTAGGAGLGLAIVRSIAEAHRGNVEAHNRAERGASVRLSLPAAPAPAPDGSPVGDQRGRRLTRGGPVGVSPPS
jgi:hypothetical protein